jgi:uncharacterized protein (DUF1919 family)
VVHSVALFDFHLSFYMNQHLDKEHITLWQGPSWPWCYGSWIYNYLCNQYLSPVILWVRITIRAMCTPLCGNVCQWLVTGLWFSPSSPVSSTNQTDCHDIAEILLKVAWYTIKQTKNTLWPLDKTFILTNTYQVKIKLQAFIENAVNLCPLPLKFQIFLISKKQFNFPFPIPHRVLQLIQQTCYMVDNNMY